MNKDMQTYIRELSSDYINLTLDYNTFEKLIQEIEKVIKTRVNNDTKIKKIKSLLEKHYEKSEWWKT